MSFDNYGGWVIFNEATEDIKETSALHPVVYLVVVLYLQTSLDNNHPPQNHLYFYFNIREADLKIKVFVTAQFIS